MLNRIDPEKNVTLRAMAYKLNDMNVATTSVKVVGLLILLDS